MTQNEQNMIDQYLKTNKTKHIKPYVSSKNPDGTYTGAVKHARGKKILNALKHSEL